jgi:hypothetical protein
MECELHMCSGGFWGTIGIETACAESSYVLVAKADFTKAVCDDTHGLLVDAYLNLPALTIPGPSFLIRRTLTD